MICRDEYVSSTIILAVLFNANATKTRMQDVDNHGKKRQTIEIHRIFVGLLGRHVQKKKKVASML